MCWVECVLEFENTELYFKLITFGGTVIRKTKTKKNKTPKNPNSRQAPSIFFI